MSGEMIMSRDRVNMNREDIRSVLEVMRAEEEVIQILIKEDITVEDLKTLTKRDLDELIKKYGPRRRFGRLLIEWMSSRGLPIDLQLLTAYGNVQSARIIYKNDGQQPLLLANSSNSSPSTSSHINVNCGRNNLLNTTNFSHLPSALDSPIAINSEENIIKREEFEVSSEVDVKDFIVDRAAQFEHEFEREVPEFQNEFNDFTEAVQTVPLETSENSTQQLQTHLSVSSINSEDPETRNPLLNLLRKNGSHCQKLVNNPRRNDVVPEGKEINLIAKVTVKHLISLATPPKRKVSTSTLTRWAEYFKRLFPKTPMSSFYAFKYESSRSRNGTIIQKKRAEGALQVQLFQERRKLIKEDRTVLLRCPSINYIGSDKNPGPSSNTSANRNTWRLVSRQKGEEVQPCGKVLIEIDPKLQWHLNYLCNQLHDKLTLQLVASWEATFNYRFKRLVNQPGTVWDYLNEFPLLKIEDIGKALICKDFEQLYPNIDSVTKSSGKLVEMLDDHKHAIIKTVKVVLKRMTQQEHKNIATLFLDLAERDLDIKLRITGVLLLLPFIFTHTFIEKTWKPTRIDVMDSFVARVCSETEIQEHIELRRRKSLSLVRSRSNKTSNSMQPYVLAVGPAWEHIIRAHVVVDRVLYTCETIVEATELCFKLFHAYHSDYPPESKHVWQLIQQGFYKLFINNHDLNRRTISKALADIGIEPEKEKIKSFKPT